MTGIGKLFVYQRYIDILEKLLKPLALKLSMIMILNFIFTKTTRPVNSRIVLSWFTEINIRILEQPAPPQSLNSFIEHLWHIVIQKVNTPTKD